jgi:hypothetical protein
MLSTSKGRVSPSQNTPPTKSRILYSDAVNNRLSSITASTASIISPTQQPQERVDSTLLELTHPIMSSELALSGLLPKDELRSLALYVLQQDQDGGSENISDIDSKTTFYPSTSLSDYNDYIHGGGLVQSGPVYDEELDEYVPCQFPIWPQKSTFRTIFSTSIPLLKPKSLVQGRELKFFVASTGEGQVDWVDYERQKAEKDEIMKEHFRTIATGIENGDYSMFDIPDIPEHDEQGTISSGCTSPSTTDWDSSGMSMPATPPQHYNVIEESFGLKEALDILPPSHLLPAISGLVAAEPVGPGGLTPFAGLVLAI